MEQEKIVFTTQDVQENKVMGILAYIGFLFIVPLLAAKDSPYAKFHANQGLILFIAEAILSVASWLITLPITIMSLGMLTAGVQILLGLVTGAFGISFTVLGIINACSGEPKKLPVIGVFTLIR